MEKLQAKLLERADCIRELAGVLNAMDRDKDNVLSANELKEGIKGLGVEMTEDEVMQVFTELDKDGSKTLDLTEFFVTIRGALLSEVKVAALTKVYKKLDKDDSGAIDNKDLKDGFDFEVGAIDNKEASDIFKSLFDGNDDGKVTKDEFLNFHASLGGWADSRFVHFLAGAFKMPELE